jgi:hypothetical protein
MANPTNPRFSTAEQQTGRQEQGMLGTVAGKAQEIGSTVAGTAERAWETTRQTMQDVGTQAGDVWNDLNNLMRRYPLLTFCAGLGAGLLLSQLFRTNWGQDYITRRMSDASA